MHEDILQAAKELRRQLGDEYDVAVSNNDNLPLIAAYAGMVVLTMDVGNMEHAAAAARAANIAVDINPKVRFMFGINGVGQDTREVDEIPEARATLVELFRHLSLSAIRRFEPEHRALIAVCIGQGKRIGTQLHVPAWAFQR